MQKSAINNWFTQAAENMRKSVEANPIPAVALSFFVGIVFCFFARSIITVAFLTALVVGALWFFAEDAPPPSANP